MARSLCSILLAVVATVTSTAAAEPYERAGWVAVSSFPFPYALPARVSIVSEHIIAVEGYEPPGDFACNIYLGTTDDIFFRCEYQFDTVLNEETPSIEFLYLPFDMSMDNFNAVAITDDPCGGLLITTSGRFRPLPCHESADLDQDRDVDQTDFGLLQACLTGPDIPPQAGCEESDLDGDGDVDQMDLHEYRLFKTGADVDPGLACNLPCGVVFWDGDSDPSWFGYPRIGGLWSVDIQPRATHQFTIYRLECCYWPDMPVLVRCVEWSVEPSHIATITNQGLLCVAPHAASGEILTVRATLPDPDGSTLEATAAVYRPEDNPFVGGYWHEEVALRCFPSDGTLPGRIGELKFSADSSFTVTWEPFEVYIDYHGTYEFEPMTNRLTMAITYGNYVPAETDLDGWAYPQTDGSIRLESIYLGAPPDDPNAERTCGYILRR